MIRIGEVDPRGSRRGGDADRRAGFIRKVTPAIENCYSLHETAAAIRDVAKGHVRGKAVVAVGGER